MLSVTPTEVRVRPGWLDGRPRSIVLGDETVPIVSVDAVRREVAAYPVERGPRTVFEVSTSEARLRLVFEHHRRRWLLEALETEALAEPVEALERAA